MRSAGVLICSDYGGALIFLVNKITGAKGAEESERKIKTPALLPSKNPKGEKMKKREDVYPNRGLHEYGNVEFADSVNKKYPIDTSEHIRAAWSYIHMPRDFEKYSSEDLKTIENRIIKAWKEKIDPAGPPEARK